MKAGEVEYRKLLDAGFRELDDRRAAVALLWIAEALDEVPAGRPWDVNEWVGTKHGIASGWVYQQVDRLVAAGYVVVRADDGVRLTPRGADAALVLGGPPIGGAR